MNVDARINLNLSQRLVMTPMLQQAIKLLQMSRLELVDLVKQEMMENPVLDELEEYPDRQDDFSLAPLYFLLQNFLRKISVRYPIF